MSKALDVFSRDDLFTPGRPAPYTGDKLAEAAFPLGGIGTGCVSLAGDGGLVDWEVFNRPNKGSILPYCFFTLWTHSDGREPVTRVLQAPPRPSFSGAGGGRYGGMGFGVIREKGSGLPHVRSASLRGEFPLAEITFEDANLPVQVCLEAYSPFIPLNADDSGLPIAVLRYHLRNTSGERVTLSLSGNMMNPIGYKGSGPLDYGQNRDAFGGNVNRFVDEGGVRGLALSSEKVPADSPRFGTMALTTTWPEVYCQTHWLQAGWFDMMHDFWDHLSATGTLPERSFGPSVDGTTDIGTLGLRATLAPGESATLPFFITWHFPNFQKYWAPAEPPGSEAQNAVFQQPVWRNYYASQWQDALDVAHYYAANEERLYAETKRFHDTLFASKLPPYVLDAISSQASILHSPTVLRLTDGTFYGFEGCHSDAGCCEGSCTHVWNYAQTVAFLFPELERSLRDADYRYNLAPDGRMGFRLQLPLGEGVWAARAAADGQMGGLMKVYRDWRLCGDDDWLRGLWSSLKKALEYAWQPGSWDLDQDGVMEGIQHNTYDIEFYGPNTMMGSFYLGALRAGEEMARHLGDTAAAETYRALFEKGRARMEGELYNGEFYVQEYDPEVAPKYQYGSGCLSDQMIGQWFAHLAGLGYLFEPKHARSAIKAVFDHNWLTSFWEHANPQRIYALNDEQGLLLCSWPNGGRPELPFVYSDEVWCGIEYQVASHLIYEGLVEEGLAVVKGVRDRHDGRRRNPWNEFECGSHYARSLASWAVLTALSGYSYDLPNKALGFAPRLYPEDWSAFWSAGTGWGTFAQKLDAVGGEARLSVAWGSLPVEGLTLGSVSAARPVRATLGGRELAAKAALHDGALVVTLPAGTQIQAGEELVVRLG
ncbi:MAG: GH116 family glycosyl-hydrolase [Anaerolineae bacterium]